MKRGNILVTVVLGLAMLGGFGCGKITKQNYDKIEVGMDYAQVATILGENPRCDAVAGAKECTWGDAEKNIKVKFIADKVVLKSSEGMEGK